MFELITYGFMQKALLGGLAIGVITGLIGPYLVLRRMALLGDGLAHLAFGGVALGLLFDINPLISAFVLCIIGALFVERLINKQVYGDAAIALILSAGIGLGIIIIGAVEGFGVNLFSFLIGSILTLSSLDLFIIFMIAAFVISFVTYYYDFLLSFIFNTELTRLAYPHYAILSSLFTILVAMTTIASIRAVGILLVTALLVLPSLITMRLFSSFKGTLIGSVMVSTSAILLGIILSFYLDLPPSGVIVGLLLAGFVLTSSIQNIVNKGRRKQASK